MSEQGDESDVGDKSYADEGFEHLQSAAKEMIHAARSFLDAAEGLVDDPSALRSVSGLMNDVVGRFTSAAGGSGGGSSDGDDDGYERIRVS